MTEEKVSGFKVPDEDKVGQVLMKRGSTYGDYKNNAHVTQEIMFVLSEGLSWKNLNHMHREALHMIAHKMSRIVNGNPDLQDSWDDIAGYARLVSERITPDANSK